MSNSLRAQARRTTRKQWSHYQRIMKMNQRIGDRDGGQKPAIVPSLGGLFRKLGSWWGQR